MSEMKDYVTKNQQNNRLEVKGTLCERHEYHTVTYRYQVYALTSENHFPEADVVESEDADAVDSFGVPSHGR